MPEATLTPQEFYERWRNTTLGERQSYQAHFMDVCKLVGYETPTGSGVDSKGNEYVFEKSLKKQGGEQGYADVYLQRHFAIEYKAPGKHKTLDDAYNQLLQYREKLENPYLLVVTDIQNWQIHTNFPNSEKRIYEFTHDEIATNATKRDYLRHLFHQPERLHPTRNKEQVTGDAANAFKLIADNMRMWDAEPERIAHFLTKLVFCLFAEDVGLLPAGTKGETGVFSEIVENYRTQPDNFVASTEYLFRAMADGGKLPFVNIEIPYFNGSLFDDVQVERLELEALTRLEQAARLNWESVEPVIFGTLFERSLDPSKRSQLGAHYTSREDILLIIGPVLMQPLERQWQAVQAEAAAIRQKYDAALNSGSRRDQTLWGGKLTALRDTMLERLSSVTVLDPACGSGNFLYVALQQLLTMEKAVITHELFAGLTQPFPQVHPRQMYGIEINPIAHALASIVVWIGYIQWRKQNGFVGWSEPILEPMAGNIVCKDAILAFDGDGRPTEPQWPAVDVIVGNPPFLGGGKLRGELGDEYYETLTRIYNNRLPGFSDLVCYWFERARREIEQGRIKRAGLLATNSIRGGANREVLKRIKETGDIFMAWADREWILDGAAVRVSMIGFDGGEERNRTIDSIVVQTINSDLTASVDITISKRLYENRNISFQGPSPKGNFDITESYARQLLKAANRTGADNSDVVKPVLNAADIVKRHRKYWTIDFGTHTTEEDAKKYEGPYQYVLEKVYPIRRDNNRKGYREKWWLYAEPRVDMRIALEKLPRYIVTPRVAKHRLFVWIEKRVMSNDALIAIARDDDYFFGVLHSTLHEVWSLRMGTSLEDRPRYTPTTTFETFPFPFPPGSEDQNNPHVIAIGAAARQLHEERDAWLNPPHLKGGDLKERTLTNLYNALSVMRGKERMKIKLAAGDFAPRLDELHTRLDAAVCAAYGCDPAILESEEEILKHLLALNLQRASGEA